MKYLKNFSLLLAFFIVFIGKMSVFAYPMPFDKETKSEKVKEYIIEVGTASEFLWGKFPVDDRIAQIADSLSYLLYEEKTELPLYLQVSGRLRLEDYNMAAENGKTDYHQVVVALNSCKNAPAFYDKVFLRDCINLGDYKMEQGDFAQAREAFSLALTCATYEDNKGKFEEFLPTIYFNLAYSSYLLGKYDVAIACQQLCIAKKTYENGRDDEDFTKDLSILGYIQEKAGKKEDAIDTYRLLVDPSRTWKDEDMPTYFDTLLKLAELSGEREYYDKLYESITDENVLFPQAMSTVAAYYEENGEKDRVIKTLDRVIRSVEEKKVDARELKNFMAILNNYYVEDNYRERMVKIIKANLNPSEIKDKVLLVAALCCNNEFDSAYRGALEVESMANQKTDMTTEELMAIMGMWSDLEEYEKAIRWGWSVINLLTEEKGLPEYSVTSLKRNVLELLASYNSRGGNPVESKRIIESLLESSDHDNDREELLWSLIYTLHASGDYKGVEKVSDQLIKIASDPNILWGVWDFRAAVAVGEFEKSYEYNDRVYETFKEKGTATLQKLREITDKYFSDDLDKVISQLFHEGVFSYLTGDKEKMRGIIGVLENLIEDVPNKNMQDFYRSRISTLYILDGKYQEAINNYRGTTFRDEYIKASDLQILYEAFLGLGDRKRAQHYFSEAADLIMKKSSNDLYLLTESERENLWNTYEDRIAGAGRFADENDEDSEFGGVVYDLALNAKGMLLSYSKKLTDVLENVDHPEVKGLYDMLVRKKKRRSESMRITAAEDSRLEKEIADIEHSLMADMKGMGYVPEKEVLNWRMIKNRLREDDVAIEFLEFSDLNYKKSFGAAVVSPSLKNPVIIHLGSVDSITTVIKTDFRANAVWEKLLPYLSRTGCNYFSPIGRLISLPVESLLLDDGNPVGTVYPLSRLSSTRELLLERRKSSGRVALFGGINYGKRSISGTTNHRGVAYRLPFLPGTEKELNKIAQLLNENEKFRGKVEAYDGDDGSESSLRALSGKEISLLHIGTHGYFLTDSVNNFSRLPYMARSLYKGMGNRQNTLALSGLFMAGVNEKNDSVSDSKNDGIVTAYEIAALDFSNVDLAVLSACETGLGTVTADGVLGLQRGLKLAGVNSILMTLDKVDDSISYAMMEKFYKGLLSGQGKQKAFDEAKEYIRESYPESRCWASFILLDGI